MKRLRRIILNALTVLSLLLCVATAMLWVWSYSAERWILRADRGYAQLICLLDGRMLVETSPWPNEGRFLQIVLHSAGRNVNRPWLYHQGNAKFFSALGFTLERGTVFNSNYVPHGYAIVVVPLWFIMLCEAVLPGLWMTRWRRAHRRMGLGRCPVCSYDLRATPNRCPECGTIPAEARA